MNPNKCELKRNSLGRRLSKSDQIQTFFNIWYPIHTKFILINMQHYKSLTYIKYPSSSVGLLWHWRSKKQKGKSTSSGPTESPFCLHKQPSSHNFCLLSSILNTSLPIHSHIDLICKFDFLTTISLRNLK